MLKICKNPKCPLPKREFECKIRKQKFCGYDCQREYFYDNRVGFYAIRSTDGYRKEN